MDQIIDKDKRRFISNLKSIMGASVAIGLINTVGLNSALAFERITHASISKGKLFTYEEMVVLASVVQTIIPKTDTAGAADVNCHGFIDHQLSVVHTKAEQEAIKRVIAAIEQRSNEHFKITFSALSPQKKITCLTNIETGKWADQKLISEFKVLKSLNAFGYFTSEIGATQVLDYQAIPGGYRGSVKVTGNVKNPGLLAFY